MDPLKEFFSAYRQGDLVKAVSQILPVPDFSYNSLHSSDDRLLQQVVHLVDASVFGTLPEVVIQNFFVKDFIANQAQQSEMYYQVLEGFLFEDQLLAYLLGEKREDEKPPGYFSKLMEIEKGEGCLEEEKIREIVSASPKLVHTLINFHIAMANGWHQFKKAKPLWLKNFSKEYIWMRPWYPFQSTLSVPALNEISEDQIPIIFFEPVQKDLSSFMHKLQGQSAIYAFMTLSSFFQMLQFPAFVNSLGEEDHLLYILELYPNPQFSEQDLKNFRSKKLLPICFSSNQWMNDYVPPLLQALEACLNLPRDQLAADTPEGNWAYEVSKRLLVSIQQKRLGLHRMPALTLRLTQTKWYDPHKGLTPSDKPLGPPIQDQMQVLLSKLAENRYVRPRIKKEKYRLVHVVPQIVFGGHAPTRLLENLVMNHDSKHFEVLVICTELLREVPLEYPFNFYLSMPSKQRGESLIHQFEKLGVRTFINQKYFYYLSNAMSLSKWLSECVADIVVFHGPDIINLMAAQMTDVPLRVLFEHGSQSPYPGFDLAILSSDAALQIYSEQYKKIGTQAMALPFAIDVRKEWLENPYPLSTLGLPEEALVLTTISTKLDTRLSEEMCEAIASILKQVPNAYYAPVGTLNNVQRIKNIFQKYGVEERLHPLGAAIVSPSQYVRCMHLYLNEFPVGGCLAILDAMAAGCPVVTMYDEKGPQQARYGGNFMGLDRTVSSTKEYVDLAVRLLTDQTMHKEWSNHTLQQYEKFADVKSYVKSFETIVLNSLIKSE